MLESGQQFGLYVVKDVFEKSASQACCCAEDPFFNREVILKTYSTELFSAGHKLNYLEALLERLAVLDHPSIAPIYDSGLEEDCFYYTSASYSAVTLAQRMSRALAGDEALKIIFELTQALDYALERGLGQGRLKAENICFDADGRAVFFAFGIDSAIEQLLVDDSDVGLESQSAHVAETLRSLGELLLQMLLGPVSLAGERIDDLCAGVENVRIRRLLGRFLLPGEWRFASFAELLEELGCFDEVDSQLSVASESAHRNRKTLVENVPSQADQHVEKMVADVRRLVAEKNSLQQALDNALYERNQADNKLVEGQRQLAQVQQDVNKAKEEANVAWELVAGQKYDRWRPAAWAVGGFLLGFVLSGSYGYYYSEQTRSELLARLKANEELIKAASWPAAVQAKQAEQTSAVTGVAAAPVTLAPPQTETRVNEVKPATEVPPIVVLPPIPVGEETQQWWPAGSEFSAAAAVPIEQIKAALGFEKEEQLNLPEELHQEVLATVQRWAESWSRQDLASYFSVYSQNYLPELGRSQQEWRNMRQSRLTKPQWIELDLDDIRVRQLDDDRIQVKLKQSYRSDFYQDQILKSINLIKEDGHWRILMERSLGMISHTDLVGG